MSQKIFFRQLTLMKINGLLDLPIDQLMYVYRLTVKETGHVYVGKTGNLQHRLYAHLKAIGELLDNPDTADQVQPMHRKVAELLRPAYEKTLLKQSNFLMQAISVDVLALVADHGAIDLLERHYISQNHNLSLNEC